jgi:predicted ATPase
MARRSRGAPGPFLLHLLIEESRIADRNAFPFSLPAIAGLKELRFHPSVTFLVGENGSGKSTLLEGIAVACGLNPEGGSRNFRFATRESHSGLGDSLRIAKAPVICPHLLVQSL